MARLATALRREEGQALIEFAVVLPVLLLLVMGILFFGRFLNYSSQATRMASQAARWAAVNTNPGSGTLQAYVAGQASGELASGSTDVTAPAKVYLYYPTGSSGAAGSAVRACVTFSFHFLPNLGITDTTVAQTATMRLEQTPSNWTPDTPPTQCSLS